MKKVGPVLRAARESAGVSQSALARRVGISAAQLAQIENGHRANPHFLTVARIAGAMGLSLDAVASLCGVAGFSKPQRDLSPRRTVRIRIDDELGKAQRDIEKVAKRIGGLRTAVGEGDD